MKKYFIGLLLALVIATPVSGYTVRPGDTPYGIWGSNWKTELAKYGITDPRKLPVGLDIQDDVLGISLPTVVALFEDSLASRLSSTATSTFTLVRGTDKQSRSLSGRYGFIIDEGTATEEFFIATCSGTTCTIVTRGLDVADGQTAVAGNQYEHRRGATVKATDFPQLALITRVLSGSESTGSSTFIIGDGVNTNKTLRFDNGNANTPEMVYDATTNQLKFRRSGETTYTEIPLSLRGTYANYASLPTSASIGDIAITIDDNKLYTYSGSTWVLAGGSSGAGTVYKTNKLGSESDGGNLTTFSLTAGSWPSSNFLLVYKNGQSQREGASYDYTVTDSDTIEFNNAVASDDTIQMFVVSVDLYNPAWGVVNASIIPDTNNAYDIGTATSSFKDVYVTGTLYLDGVGATSTATANAVPIADSNSVINFPVSQSYTAGESIDSSSTPISVFLHTDGKVYKTASGAATTTFTFIGFATKGQTKSANESINVQITGNVSGFTGMTTGSVYYVSTAGTISGTAGTVNYKIGRALTPTVLLIEKGKKVVSGLLSVYSDADAYSTTTINTGFIPTKITVLGCSSSGNNVSSLCTHRNAASLGSTGIYATSYWVNGTTYGYTYNGSAIGDSTAFLIDYIVSSEEVELSVSTVSLSSVLLVLRQASDSTDLSGLNVVYTIEE